MFHVQLLYRTKIPIAITTIFGIIIVVTTIHSNELGQDGNVAALS